MKTIKTEIKIGLNKPLNIIHVSDTHLTLVDSRDNQRKIELGNDRVNGFPEAENNLREIINSANQNGYMVVHTGDLIDFVSELNLQTANAFYKAVDAFMVAGNHEFSQYVGEAWEDADYRNQSLQKVQSAFENDIRCYAKVVGGVNFVGLDNGYYLFEQEQYEFLKKQLQKGLPIVLCMHVPLYQKGLYKWRMKNSPCAYLVGVPKRLMKCYPEYRYRQQLADKITLKTIRLIKKSKQIKALLCGHIHNDFVCKIKNKPQIITGVNTLRELTIK